MNDKKRNNIIKYGLGVVDIQQKAISTLKDKMDDTFVQLVESLLDLKGKLIISGIGKSGNIARKIASTLSSTGTPSIYLHPVEAEHGDLGVISKNDMVMLLSNSGNISSLTAIINYCKRFGITIIGMTRNENSELVAVSDIKVILPEISEASLLGAPTTSSTMMIVYGDALAVALHNMKGFSKEDYKILHPGGSLGAQLSHISDVMHTGDEMPLVLVGMPVAEAIIEITAKRFGCVGVNNTNGELIGIISDGDLRRHIYEDLRHKKVEDIMTKSPKALSAQNVAVEALSIMNLHKITNMFVVKDKIAIGVVHIHDLLKLGVA